MTSPSSSPGTAALDGAWRLSPSVSLRKEPFGALLYDFTTRQLSFLKTPTLVRVVCALVDTDTVDEALSAAGVSHAQRPAYLTALRRLAESGLIQERPHDLGCSPAC